MKKSKSLLIFIPSIENGGVEKNLYLVANYLAKKNVSVKILTSFNNQVLKAPYKEDMFSSKTGIIKSMASVPREF